MPQQIDVTIEKECGFYNSINHDRMYDAEDMTSIFDGIIRDGVFQNIGDYMLVTPGVGAGLQVVVGTGKCWFNRTWTINSAAQPIELHDAPIVLSRIDAIVVEVNETDRKNYLKVIRGTEDASPSRPELVDDDNVHQHALAYVKIGPGVTSITSENITNAIGTTETPFVTAILQIADLTTLFDMWMDQFDDWKIEKEGDITTWINSMRGLISTVDAAHILALISENRMVKKALLVSHNQWALSGTHYYIDIALTGMTADGDPIVDIDHQSSGTDEDWLQQIDSWNTYRSTGWSEAMSGKVRLYCLERPENDFYIKVKGVY